VIHLALTIVSALFLVWLGALVLAFVVAAWRWVLGALAVIVFVLVGSFNRQSKTDDGAQEQARAARAAHPVAAAASAPAHALLDPQAPGGWRCIPIYRRQGNECVDDSRLPAARDTSAQK
jgi:uncharacterized membrane protein